MKSIAIIPLILASALSPAATAETGGPRILIFNAAQPAEAPQVLRPNPSPSAVPKAPLLIVTIGAEEGGRSTSVTVEEKEMILDQGKTAKPGKKKRVTP